MNNYRFQQLTYLLTIFLGAVLLMGHPATSYAQDAIVNIHMANVRMQSVMKEIENQTDYLFISNEGVDINSKVTVHADSRSVRDVLTEMLRGTDVSFRLDGQYIILSRSEPQKPVTITGTVVDASGEPLIGVAVMVKGTVNGVSTGVDGTFTLSLQPPVEETVLVFNCLGFEPFETVIGKRSVFNVTLEEESFSLEGTVVTALGIRRSEKALSYNVQQVDSDEILAVKDANFVNSLNGKVAGLVINASSSGVGGASKVVMRGEKSILQSSNALYVIDGVPMYAPTSTAGTEFGSQGTTEPIADINPEDIESMSVLSGAAAAALYGSDAANGAIIVTTKKGQAGKTTVTFSSNTEISNAFVTPDFQTRYGTGDLSSSTGSSTRSWGNKLNQFNYVGYEPTEDYFQTSVTATESFSFSTGNDRNQTYFSAAAVDSKGIIPNNKYSRYNFTFRNTTSFLSDRMTLDVGASYILQKDRNMTNQGVYNNPLVGAYLFPRGDSWDDIRMYERYDSSRKIYTQYWPMGDVGMTVQNPYWINYRNLRENNKDRYMLNASLTYKVLDWLTLSGRIRLDSSVNDYTEKFYATTNEQLTEDSDRGLYGITRTKDRQIYGDVMANINKNFGEDWSLQANIGASFSDMKSDGLQVRGPIADGSDAFGDESVGLTNYFAVQNLSASQTVHLQEGWREQTQSVFASAEVGFKGAYYLTLTGRNDWPSQLAGPRSSTSCYFYPSVGGSIVLSQILNMPDWFSYLKLRASYASVGVAFERYIANPRYEWDSSINQWSNTTQYPIENLKPERTKSFEVGADLRFLDGFNLTATYYSARTMNQTFDPDLAVSGWSSIYLQTGSVRNNGIELGLGYSKTWKNFGWSSNYTFSTNSNKILELADNAINPVTGETFSISILNMGGLGNARFLLKEGGSMGDLYSLVDLKRDSNGNIYVDADGNIATETITDPDKYIKLGSVLPKANMSWRNDFRWKNFNAGFQITARLGGVVYSRTQAMLDYYGVSEATATDRDLGYSVVNSGDRLEPQAWYETIGGGNTVPQYYTYSATNVRLQEATIGYTIPRNKLGDVCEIYIALVGKNLWMIYNHAPFDPESIASTTNFYQGIDYFMMPSLRSVGFNLRVKF